MGPWTVHIYTVHSWQSQLLRAGKKKKKGKRGEKNVDVQTKRSHYCKYKFLSTKFKIGSFVFWFCSYSLMKFWFPFQKKKKKKVIIVIETNDHLFNLNVWRGTKLISENGF